MITMTITPLSILSWSFPQPGRLGGPIGIWHHRLSRHRHDNGYISCQDPKDPRIWQCLVAKRCLACYVEQARHSSKTKQKHTETMNSESPNGTVSLKQPIQKHSGAHEIHGDTASDD